jgi:hypothetical protein
VDFFDLTAAYDTVWRDGLMLKFMQVVACAKLSNLLNNMLSNGFFQRLNNKLPQGYVLVPLLFSLYLFDIPSTLSNQFQYADDIALTYQHESLSDYEAILEVDLERLNQYFHRWRLETNPSKTESCVFLLSIHHANRVLDIQFAATQIQHVEHPKYLGVTFDRSLTFNTHLSKTSKKVAVPVIHGWEFHRLFT